MSDNLDTFLVEFKCPVKEKDEEGNPVEEFERCLSKQNRPFSVEEFIVEKEEFAQDDNWVEWFAEHPDELEAFVAVFLVEKKNKQYFDDLFTLYINEQEKKANQENSADSQ